MRRLLYTFILLILAVSYTAAQSPSSIKLRCPAPFGSIYGSITVQAGGDVAYRPCPADTSIFYYNVDFSNATVTGLPFGIGTVTSVTSANTDATVATSTTTPIITIVSAPKLTTARTIGGTSFDGTANITPANATNSTNTTNLLGGLGGQIPYQSAVNTTALLANGTAGDILKSNGTTLAPSWLSALPVANGGTAAITASNARTNLGAQATLSGTFSLANFTDPGDGVASAAMPGTIGVFIFGYVNYLPNSVNNEFQTFAVETAPSSGVYTTVQVVGMNGDFANVGGIISTPFSFFVPTGRKWKHTALDAATIGSISGIVL